MIINYNNPSDTRKYPKRWQTIQGRYLFDEIDNRSEDGSEELLTVSHITGITPRSMKNVTMFQAESLIGYKKCEVGDIGTNTMWVWQGAIGVSKYAGVISPSYNVYRQKASVYDPRYLDYLLRERKMVDIYHSLSTGIRPSRLRMYPEQFFSIDFPVPDLTEQRKIVEYLEWKVSIINRLLRAERKRVKDLFDLIQLQLYSDDLSVSEIGGFDTAFPSTWKMMKARYLFQERNEKGFTDKELLAVTQDRGVLYKKDCAQKYVQPDDVTKQKLVCEKDYIISLRSFQGGIETSYVSGLVSAAYSVFSLKKDYEKYFDYYALLFKSEPFITYLNSLVKDIRDGKKIGFDEFCECWLPIPPDDVLDKILKLKKQFESLSDGYQRMKTDLMELKTQIISEVINGEIDVRNAVIPEYETMADDDLVSLEDDLEETDDSEEE